MENISFVLAYQMIEQAQAGDAWLQFLCQQNPNKFNQQMLVPDTAVGVFGQTKQAMEDLSSGCPFAGYLLVSLHAESYRTATFI
jgi:hypothetical protein